MYSNTRQIHISNKAHFCRTDIENMALQFRKKLVITMDNKTNGVACHLLDDDETQNSSNSNVEILGTLPALYPEWLGDRTFTETHNVKFSYVGGAMANGISTTKMVIALARVGIIGFFGAAGLTAHEVQCAINELIDALDRLNLPWGVNLIHTPEEPYLEEKLVDLYLKNGVKRVSASAYMTPTPAVIRYACTGLRKNINGDINRAHFIFAKISRPEVARHFMSPAPDAILYDLSNKGKLTAEEVALAKQIPLAEDITVEADSGGHTDQQALTVIFPTISYLRDRLCKKFSYIKPIRIGAAGGLGTPNAVAAAFSMGAAYVLTGTVNQACVESGLHESGKALLSKARIGDVVMTPASDMFEIGVKLQVLKKGTMYPIRAAKLYDIYTRYKSLEEIPSQVAEEIQKTILRQSFEDTWKSTVAFWSKRDPSQITKAEQDPKYKMALVFRAYLGMSSLWAITGDPERRMDYQIWCGPAMAAFNEWTQNSFLAESQNRQVAQVALNLLEGAAAITRASQLRSFGIPVFAAFNYRPRPLRYELAGSTKRSFL